MIGIVGRYLADQIACQFHSIRQKLRPAETTKMTEPNRFAFAFHSYFSVRYYEASAPSESGWSPPSMVEMSSETVGWMLHGPLNDRIRRAGIHDVKDRVGGLGAAGSRDHATLAL